MAKMIDEQEFKRRADEALASLNRDLIAASDDYGFEVDFNAGALGLEFEDPPAKFVISPNAPVRQIWVSANNRSYKLDWDVVQNSFVHGESRDTLKALLEKAIGKHLGEEVSL
jgi:CyaY protein